MKKLLVVASLARTVYGRWLFRHLLAGMVLVACLLVITSIMASAAVLAGTYAVYLTLLHYGFAAQHAMMITALLDGAITVILVIITRSHLHQLQNMPATVLRKSPATSRAGEAIDAFFDGLLTGERIR